MVAAARLWGLWLERRGHDLTLAGVPLFGHWDVRAGWRILPAVALAVAVATTGPRLAARLRWSVLLGVSALTAVAWSVALAVVDGWEGLTHGVESQHEYLPFARSIEDIPAFLRNFTEQLPGYPTHVKGHPPGMVVVLALLDRVGLGGRGWAAALDIAGGALAVVAVLVLARAVAGEPTARRAVPFVVASPAAIWIASSADAFFAGVALSGVALLATSRGRTGGRRAVAAGMLLGSAVHLSYGLVLIAPLALVVLPSPRRARHALLAGAGGLAVTAAFIVSGFSWWSGLAATHRAYWDGAAAHRPYAYFLLGNLGAFALAAGPVTAAALPLVRRNLWPVVGAALLGVVLADLSGMSKGEVERIWLFLLLPTLLAAGAMARRRWLVLHVTAGLVLAVTFDAGW